MTIYSTIPDDQAIVLPKKGTNFKGRLVSYAALAFALGAIVATSVGTASAPVTQIQPSLASEPAPAANEKLAAATPPRRTPRKARSRDRRERERPTARTTTASTGTRAASRKPLLPVAPSSARRNSLQLLNGPFLLLSLPTVY